MWYERFGMNATWEVGLVCGGERERDAKVLREGMMMEECGWIYWVSHECTRPPSCHCQRGTPQQQSWTSGDFSLLILYTSIDCTHSSQYPWDNFKIILLFTFYLNTKIFTIIWPMLLKIRPNFYKMDYLVKHRV